MSRFTSYGVCALCGKRTSKAAMTRHLSRCLAEHEASQGAVVRLFRLRIEDAWSPFFWMDVEIKADATLDDLDDFLRHKWLECCGHLSAFYIEGDTYMVSRGMESGGPFGDPNERSMKAKLAEVLSKGSRFTHVYDFGTSTELKLRVADEREGRSGREPLRLLSSNEAPVWECELCGDDADWICTLCMYERENPFYCSVHAADHDCEDPEMLLLVVDSPRMGMCGYGRLE